MVRTMTLIGGLRKSWERFCYEQVPLTAFFVNAQKEVEVGESQKGIPAICAAEIAGDTNHAIAVTAESRLTFKMRLPAGAKFSSWVAVGLEAGASHEVGVEFGLGLEQGGNVTILSRHRPPPSRLGLRRRWAQFSADLGGLARQEVSLVLQTSRVNPQPNDGIAFWGNPRILRRRSAKERVAKSLARLTLQGFPALLRSLLKGLHSGKAPISYARWIRKHTLTGGDLGRIPREIEEFRYRPLISVITPVHDVHPNWLARCIESVRCQLYPDWELCLVDDYSTKPGIQEVLRKYEALDDRIKVRRLDTNLGISKASNTALSDAHGEYVATLDHDDELAPEALFEVVKLLQKHPEADVLYSDEDKLELDGTRNEPFFKPDWSPEYLLSCMYIGHLMVCRRQLVNAVGGFRPGFEGSQDYDLMLRLVERTQNVFHIPRVLYHWRKTGGSTAADPVAKLYSVDAGKRALEDHLKRRDVVAEVTTTRLNSYRVKFALRDTPLVSIIIPCKDGVELLRECLRSIQEETTYPRYEIVILHHDCGSRQMTEFLSCLPHPVVRFCGAYNFSRMNNLAVAHAKGSQLVFLNDDTRVMNPEWISAMLEFTQQEPIGVAGAKLYYPDGRIQHAGVILGMYGLAEHSHKTFSGTSSGYFNQLFVIRNCSAVTAACMMVRRNVFDLVGGFDEGLAVSFNDVDLCLRVRAAGFRIVWTPFAELYHQEMATRGFSWDGKEVHYMEARWGQVIMHDPYYNENLALDRGDFSPRV